MPTTWIARGIVLFWLVSMSLLAWQEFAPLLETDRPPPFAIDLVAEATGQEPTVFWNIYRLEPKQPPREIGRARTTLLQFQPHLDIFRSLEGVRPPKEPDPPGRESFILHGELIEFDVYSHPLVGRLMIKKMETLLRVDQTGALMWLGAYARLSAELGPAVSRTPALNAVMTLQGEVIKGELKPHVAVRSDFAGHFKIEGETVAIPPTSVLNPMQPVNRLVGLRPGMRWRMPGIDPLGAAMRASFQTAAQKVLPDFAFPDGPTYFDAEVLADTEPITIKAGTFPCRIVEYRSKTMTARTYVKIADGLVLRQEAMSLHDGAVINHFRLQRE